MRSPRVRFTVRRMMIAVAVVGIAFAALAGLQRMDQRRQTFVVLARNHLQQGVVNRLTFEGLVAHRAAKVDTERYRMLAEYHHALNLKYKYAARHPWLSVAPDPPEPK